MQRGTATLSLTRPLTPNIVPESELVLINHKTSANRVWLVETADHVIKPGQVAYTEISCVIPGGNEKEVTR